MRQFPAGLLVFGDAICSFNPIYGQGMTVAALQAMALDRCLRGGAERLAARYFSAAAKPIGVAWQLAVGGDLNLPEVQGPRPLSMRLTNKYVDRVQAAAETDTVIATRFLKVAGFSKPAAASWPRRSCFELLRQTGDTGDIQAPPSRPAILEQRKRVRSAVPPRRSAAALTASVASSDGRSRTRPRRRRAPRPQRRPTPMAAAYAAGPAGPAAALPVGR